MGCGASKKADAAGSSPNEQTKSPPQEILRTKSPPPRRSSVADQIKYEILKEKPPPDVPHRNHLPDDYTPVSEEELSEINAKLQGRWRMSGGYTKANELPPPFSNGGFRVRLLRKTGLDWGRAGGMELASCFTSCIFDCVRYSRHKRWPHNIRFAEGFDTSVPAEGSKNVYLHEAYRGVIKGEIGWFGITDRNKSAPDLLPTEADWNEPEITANMVRKGFINWYPADLTFGWGTVVGGSDGSGMNDGRRGSLGRKGSFTRKGSFKGKAEDTVPKKVLFIDEFGSYVEGDVGENHFFVHNGYRPDMDSGPVRFERVTEATLDDEMRRRSMRKRSSVRSLKRLPSVGQANFARRVPEGVDTSMPEGNAKSPTSETIEGGAKSPTTE